MNFYVSDEENAIDGFEHLNVTITTVGFQRAGAGDAPENESDEAGNETDASEDSSEDAGAESGDGSSATSTTGALT